MPYEYYDDNERGGYGYNSDESEDDCYYDDLIENYDFEEDYFEDEYIPPNITDKYPMPIAAPIPSARAEWKNVKIGNTAMWISNEGKIYFVDIHQYYITDGFREIGTPYRYVDIEFGKDDYQRCYVHDIVWKTFKSEPIPDGWEVRHYDLSEMDEMKCYINHVDYLELYKKINITRNFELKE